MPKCCPIAPDLRQYRAAEHGRWVAEQGGARINGPHEGGMAGGMIYPLHRAGAAVLSDICGPAANHAIIGMRVQKGPLPSESVGMADVIGIHAGNEYAP